MERKIVVSALLNQLQVGIVEQNRLVEYYLERDGKERLVGSIYQGRVENILPGMAAAFVDIGTEKNAFLFLEELPSPKGQQKLKIGDAILVQVTKEVQGAKGPRVTTKISIPGRYLVLMPFDPHVGISRQISEGEERDRLKSIATEIRPQDMGLIVRTVAVNHGKDELIADLEELLETWSGILKRRRKKNRSYLIYEDHDLVHRVLRDLYVPGQTSIVVDSVRLQKQAKSELKRFGLKNERVSLYTGRVNLFTHLGLEKDLERARQNRVWLDCGGYLVFNQTEALLSIDVNTGKYVGKDNLQDTVLKTNLQAAEEIAVQLRLRNVGGIVIIDFIDMTDPQNRVAVLAKLAESLEGDKTRTNLLGFTRLGLVELTRRKSKRLLTHILEVDCPHCHGTGRVVSDETVTLKIAAEINTLAAETDVEAVLVRCHPIIGAQLNGVEGRNLAALERQIGKVVFVKTENSFARHSYQLSSGKIATLSEALYFESDGTPQAT